MSCLQDFRTPYCVEKLGTCITSQVVRNIFCKLCRDGSGKGRGASGVVRPAAPADTGTGTGSLLSTASPRTHPPSTLSHSWEIVKTVSTARIYLKCIIIYVCKIIPSVFCGRAAAGASPRPRACYLFFNISARFVLLSLLEHLDMNFLFRIPATVINKTVQLVGLQFSKIKFISSRRNRV